MNSSCISSGETTVYTGATSSAATTSPPSVYRVGCEVNALSGGGTGGCVGCDLEAMELLHEYSFEVDTAVVRSGDSSTSRHPEAMQASGCASRCECSDSSMSERNLGHSDAGENRRPVQLVLSSPPMSLLDRMASSCPTRTRAARASDSIPIGCGPLVATAYLTVASTLRRWGAES